MSISPDAIDDIVDCQVHESLAWQDFSAHPELRNDIAIEIGLAHMDAAGVSAALFATRDELAAQAARQHPTRFAWLLQSLGPDDDDIEERLAGINDDPTCLGTRLLLTAPNDAGRIRARVLAGDFDRFFAAAERLRIPLAVFVSRDIPILEPILERYPELILLVDHLGMPQPPMQEPTTPPFLKLPELIALARYPHVAVKFSGVPTLSAEPYPFADIWPRVMPAIEAFGPERMVWGTDIQRVRSRFHPTPTARGDGTTGARPWTPVDLDTYDGYLPHHSYAEAVGFVRDTSELSRDEKALILGGALRAILRWPRP